jgi:small subunit ribosomal protein S18
MTTEEITSAAPSEGAREPRGDRPDRDDRGGGRRFGARRRGCEFCIEKVDEPDYKDVSMLRRYISDRGKLEPRRKAGTCAKHQRRVAVAVKRARQIALLPYTSEHVRISGVAGGRPAAGGRR